MPLLFRITLVYFVAGTMIVTLFRDNPIALLSDIGKKLPSSLQYFMLVGRYALPVALALLALAPRQDLIRRLSHAVIAVFVAMAFFLVFTMVKTTMPWIMPFWADPVLAEIDRALHFGHDPWAITHALPIWIDPSLASEIYIGGWMGPAMFLPVLMILTDHDAGRVRRFTWLFAFTWIVLGNVIAFVFLSAGPIYYDRLIGGAEFIGLTQAVADSGRLSMIQTMLWETYASGAQQAGSGISAFPSVHVAMATVFAIYLYERWRWLLPLSVAIVVIFQFLSVYLGWHYAVDGYVSIALVGGIWSWLRARAGSGARRVDLRSPVAAE